MKYYRNPSLDPSFNMAFDELMLKSDDYGNEPIFGLWRNRSSVIIGLNQVAEQEVNFEYTDKNEIPVIRRSTGGGAVFHDLGNLNYSFFFPKDDEDQSYNMVFERMHDTFLKLGLEIEQSPTNDLLYQGKKFSGMAKRVFDDRVLVHGTILYDVNFEQLTKALDTKDGKFNQKRGVKSRHAEVVNLKTYLRSINSIDELSLKLESILSNGYKDEQIIIKEQFLEDVRKLADDKYKRISINN